MRRFRIFGALIGLWLGLLIGCAGPHVAPIDMHSPSYLPPYTVYFSQSMPLTDRQSCLAAMTEHKLAFENGVTPQASLIAGFTLFPSASRRIYVHQEAYLNAPNQLGVLGYVDFDNNNEIHVVAGVGDIVPDLTVQLTESYFWNLPPPPAGVAPIDSVAAGFEHQVDVKLKLARNLAP